jgi:segregation and condensation protein B
MTEPESNESATPESALPPPAPPTPEPAPSPDAPAESESPPPDEEPAKAEAGEESIASASPDAPGATDVPAVPDDSTPTETPETSTPSSESAPSAPSETTDSSEETLDLSRSKLADPVAATEESEDAEPAADEVPVDMEALRRTVEALLFAAEAPLSVRELARAGGSRSHIIRKVLKALREALEAEKRPWELLEVAGGWRFATRPEFFPAIQKLKVQRSQRRLTPAAMEVLALIAYSQEPIGRAEIEAVRGVDSGPVLRQLLERKMIRIAGRGQGLGQPLLYAVSQDFLEHFGLKSARDLPQPGELKG